MVSNKFTQRFNLKVPLFVAPMAGGPSSPEFVIASCEAGAMGSVGAAYSSGKQIEEFVGHVRSKTQKPIAINLFIPGKELKISEDQLSIAIKATEKFRQQFGLSAQALSAPYEENFDQQFETVLKLKPEVFSFVFGLLKPEYVKAAKARNIFLLGTATTLDEALALQDSGVDGMTLQGIEAGGHRGIFDAEAVDAEVPVLELLKQCRSKIKIPLIAAGGIMDSNGIQSALSYGAEAVQLGTVFLVCKEAGTSEPYRKALLESAHRKTKTTRAFSGRLARGIENRFMIEMDQHPEAILPFQAQNKFTRDIRSASAKVGSSDCLSLWAGSGDGKLWTGEVGELIQQLFSTSL